MSVIVQNLARRFTEGGTPAVDDASFVTPDGAITALLGPSGSGKTTVLRMIAGLEEPDSGRVRIHDRDVTDIPVRQRAVGFVFQGYALFQNLSVRDNIGFGLRIAKAPKKEMEARVAELMKLVQLEELADRVPSQLSGGQQQRVAFARALATRPSVLLLDEPFGALDALTRGLIQDELLQIWAATQQTIFLITHDVDEAILLADRILLMSTGPRARVAEAVHNPLPRDRTRQSMYHDPRYYELRNHLLDFLISRSGRPQKASSKAGGNRLVGGSLHAGRLQ
jgi:nitrate/nitrite transport system ATP-binding protein